MAKYRGVRMMMREGESERWRGVRRERKVISSVMGDFGDGEGERVFYIWGKLGRRTAT